MVVYSSYNSKVTTMSDNRLTLKRRAALKELVNDVKLKKRAVLKELVNDVEYRRHNAYELIAYEDDFRAKVYVNAYSSYVDGIVHSTFCNCTTWYGCCDNLNNYAQLGARRIQYAFQARERDFVLPGGWRDLDVKHDKALTKKYDEMKRYESFDAFLTEHVKNSICEDVLGEILTFL